MDLRAWVFLADAEPFAEGDFRTLFFLSGRTTVMTFPTLPSAASPSSLSLWGLQTIPGRRSRIQLVSEAHDLPSISQCLKWLVQLTSSMIDYFRKKKYRAAHSIEMPFT